MKKTPGNEGYQKSVNLMVYIQLNGAPPLFCHCSEIQYIGRYPIGHRVVASFFRAFSPRDWDEIRKKLYPCSHYCSNNCYVPVPRC